ncbi:hypothetical protein PROFUN_00896 [Planoprotostelium fungivorum]|uniref:Activator of Hsp90 ATPase AHSA1-like N-terminal domain-containing protein n=1 Tax=Planoprotostelium fungivorum TaxID=1890364 RepID=A0A2P6P0A3_9EUKA|nr:hypothetical protein PROFUN_00896 [Planoprotostelium fungivorum]
MAAVGQGDPRWIVQQREDGKNVNNWHWTETDYTAWVKNRLTELIVNQTFETSVTSVETKSLKMTGEVSVNTRKAKVIFFYELDITIDWKGKISDTEDVKGTIQMPYISEENDDDDFEVRVTVEDEKDNKKSRVKDELRAKIIPFLKQKLPQLLTEMRATGAAKQLLPAKAAAPAKVDIHDKDAVAEIVSKLPEMNIPVSAPAPVPAKTSSKLRTCTLTVKEKFVCGTEDLYASFVDINRVKAYAGGDAQMSAEVGGKFKLFGGYVSGENVQLERPNKIVQKWRIDKWPEGHYSTVTMEFSQKESKVHLTLTQKDVPDSERQNTEAGWVSNYFARMKGVFGFGAAF